MAKGRKAGLIQSKLNIFLYGDYFTGKSTMASQIAYFKRPDGKPFRVLYIDPESGSIDDYLGEMQDNGINLENIYILYSQSLAEVREYIAKVKNNEDIYELDEEGNETDSVLLDADGKPFRADAIVVDGTTILNMTTKAGLVDFSKMRNRVKADKAGLIGEEKLVKIEGAGLEFKDYNTINFKGNDLVLDLQASGVHCIITARETNEKESVKQPDGTIMSVDTGKKIPEGFKNIGYNAKTVIRMFRDEDGQVCAHVEKDRTGVHKDNDIIEDPSLLDWQSVIDKTSENKAYVIKNDLTKSVKTEQAKYAAEILGDNKSELSTTSNTVSSPDELNKLKVEIINLKKSLAPDKKLETKKKLEEAGLPTAFKSVEDIDVLKKVIDIFKS